MNVRISLAPPALFLESALQQTQPAFEASIFGLRDPKALDADGKLIGPMCSLQPRFSLELCTLAQRYGFSDPDK